MLKEIKYNGYSANPDDYQCTDGDLAVSLNLYPDDNAIRTVPPSKHLFTLPTGYKLLLIHVSPSFQDKHYIILHETTTDNVTTQYFYWIGQSTIDSQTAPWTIPSSAFSSSNLIASYTADPYRDITIVGNVITVMGQTEPHYLMWSTDNYVAFSQSDLKFNVTLKWTGTKTISISNLSLGDDAPYCDIESGTSRYSLPEGVTRTIFNAIGAKANSEKDSDKQFKYFVFGVAALRFYDGSHIFISDIFTLCPEDMYYGFSITTDTPSNNKAKVSSVSAHNVYLHSHKVSADVPIINDINVSDNIKNTIKNIIAGVDIYLTEETNLLNIDKDYPVTSTTSNGQTHRTVQCELLEGSDITRLLDTLVFRLALSISKDKFNTEFDLTNNYAASEALSLADFQRRLISSNMATTYNARLNLADIQYTYFMPSNDIRTHYNNLPYVDFVLPNEGGTGNGGYIKINTGESWGTSEYVPLKQGYLIDRTRNEVGFPSASAMSDDFLAVKTMKFKVEFDNTSGIKEIIYERAVPYPYGPLIMFPSRKARKMKVYFTTKKYTYVNFAPGIADYQKKYTIEDVTYEKEFELTPSELSDYAYAINKDTDGKIRMLQANDIRLINPNIHDEGTLYYRYGVLISVDATSGLTTPGLDPGNPRGASYSEPGLIRYSQVDNPFYLPTRYTKTVGNGRIIGLKTAAKALSPSQFGQFPLYVFTTDGVWGLEVASDGTYSTNPAITQDVVLGNGESITQLDSTVLFATARGIMLLSGSTAQCISDSLNSESVFSTTSLSGLSSIAPRLTTALSGSVKFTTYIQNARMIYDYTHQRIILYNPNKAYAYIYSLKSKGWGMMESDITHGINSYPDAYAQTSSNKIINLSEYKQRVLTDPAISGLLVTRPLKLEMPDVQKTIDTIIQRGYFAKGDVQTILYASRDLYNWHLVWSSQDHYLRGFHGTPYKYFRIALLCFFKEDDCLYGCTIQHTPKLTNQPR